MSRIKSLPVRWATALVFAACAQVGTASGQTAAHLESSAAVLEHEPPAVRRLMQQAKALESAADTNDNAWQVAVRYCEASRLGSIEGQYQLGMLYAFGKGVPESRALAAALFSQAASQGHAKAGQMLDNVQMTSVELPACVSTAELPEKAPLASMAGLPFGLASGSTPSIDRFLLSLPSNKRWIIPLATTLSAWYSLDPKLVLSVIAVESNFEHGALSPKAAMGLMQLIPGTAQRFNVRNAYNATQNLRGGMAYLRWLLSYYRGNIVYALAAYNAGEGRVDRYKGVPPFPETRAYVRRVIGLYGGVSHGFDEDLTAAPPWLQALGR
ncbi:MAG: lytic transglycosylase [Burkholderiales bacterium RIFCSPHIGHO2_12_FULL_61_11]|nr:MAG: lytic transglycosylase [Burkholderiales bacterium RIFCSPHIGHO2_12_FULL_61_11]